MEKVIKIVNGAEQVYYKPRHLSIVEDINKKILETNYVFTFKVDILSAKIYLRSTNYFKKNKIYLGVIHCDMEDNIVYKKFNCDDLNVIHLPLEIVSKLAPDDKIIIEEPARKKNLIYSLTAMQALSKYVEIIDTKEGLQMISIPKGELSFEGIKSRPRGYSHGRF